MSTVRAVIVTFCTLSVLVQYVSSFGYGTYGFTPFLSNNYNQGYGYSGYGFPFHGGSYGLPFHGNGGYGYSSYGLVHHPYPGNSYYGHNKHGYYYYPTYNSFPIYGYYGNYGQRGYHYSRYTPGLHHPVYPQGRPAAGLHGHLGPHGHGGYPYGPQYSRGGSVLGNLAYMVKDLFPYLLLLKVAG